MKKLILVMMMVFIHGCSDSSENAGLSQTDCESMGGTLVGGRCEKELGLAECNAVGGKLVDGSCQQEVSPQQMKSICDSQGLEYSAEHNGCIQI